MTWITTISFDEARGRLRKLYDRVRGPDNNVDNIMLAHSLRPHAMEGHMALYKSVLHHARNELPKRLLETIGTFVSMLNRCQYCVDHHFTGLKRIVNDPAECESIYKALESGELDQHFSGTELAALSYARKLTRSPGSMVEADVKALQDAGLNDGQILEINQVTAYFAYANRTVLGLGVNTQGDIIGLSPGDSADPDNWQHS